MRSLIDDLIIKYVIGGGGEAEGGIEKEEYSIEEKKMLHEHDEDPAAVAEEEGEAELQTYLLQPPLQNLLFPLVQYANMCLEYPLHNLMVGKCH